MKTLMIHIYAVIFGFILGTSFYLDPYGWGFYMPNVGGYHFDYKDTTQ